MRTFAGLLVLTLIACGDDAAPDDACPVSCGDGTFHVTLPDGAVAFVDRDGAIERRDAAFATPPAALVIKAPGARTAERVLELGTPAGCDACTRAGGGDEVITLAPMPAPIVDSEYRTGFAATLSFDEGIAAFRALAYATSDELGPVYAVKFFLDGLGEGQTPYFQDTKRHPIHYDFVHTVLGRAVTLDAFEQATYRDTDRHQMAGTLVWRPSGAADSHVIGEHVSGLMTLEFFPSDTLTAAQARAAYLALEEAMPFMPRAGSTNRLVYLPPGARQEADAAAAAHVLAAADVAWLARAELFGGVDLQLLNPGLAYGTLRVLTPAQLDEATVSFRDVLVLPRLPNELPIVGGTLTGELQTPLAHVNVAAHARGTPNLAKLGIAEDPTVRALTGKLVRFEIAHGAYTLSEATLADATAYWTSRQGQEQLIPTADLADVGFVDFDRMGFADSDRFGVKASNVAELSHVLGERAPHGFAIPFHDYDVFVHAPVVTAELCGGAEADCLEEGRGAAICAAARALCTPPTDGATLDENITRELADPTLQTDSALRFAALDMHRWLYCHVPNPRGAELDTKVTAVFGSTPIRLRSSTNAEDLPSFSGAGLYTSEGAAIGSKDPPSERLCKVWASVWTWQAFEERAFWNIDHLAVRMGVAVHQSFPDEAANGVLITQDIADPLTVGMYVNVQAGEVSVTNPTDGAVPEVFVILPSPTGGIQVARQRFSSLSPATPILTDAEVGQLTNAAYQVQQHFAPLYGVSSDQLALDIEFKFHGPERQLFFKQVRPYHR